MTERHGAVTLGSEPQTVLGDVVEVGQQAPGFRVVSQDRSERKLEDYAGRPLFISVVPSLDTGICDAQTRRFDQEATALKDRVSFITVSADLPTAQKRWCNEAAAETIEVLSDHLEMNFGNSWGTHIRELRLNQRSVFIVDSEGVVRYVEYVPAIGQHPDYDAALAALHSVLD